MSPAEKVAARIKSDATCKVLSTLFAERSLIVADGAELVTEAFTENDAFVPASEQIAALLSEGLRNASGRDSIDDAELGRIVKNLIIDYVESGERVQRLIAEESHRIEEDEAEARRDDDQAFSMEKAA